MSNYKYQMTNEFQMLNVKMSKKGNPSRPTDAIKCLII